VTSYQLRTQPNQAADASPTVLLDWLDSSPHRSTIQYRGSLRSRLVIPAAALDLLKVAAAVYCADRLTERPGTWTRSIEMSIFVRELESWSAVRDQFAEAISFLSGDRWQLEVRASAEPVGRPTEISDPVDAVCLFSGGLDSFTGALDLLAQGKTICLVGHHGAGQANQAQRGLWTALAHRYEGQCVLRQFFLQPAAQASGQRRPLPTSREPSQRSRSLMFLAAGLTVAAGYGPDVPLHIPENGLIGINVPLTGARAGSLSTRTTHPHFIASLGECIQQLGLTNPIVNPFRTMTKGEILAACRDQKTLRDLASATLSCSHPEAARWAQEAQTNCGYCFPCLIRRASMHHVGLDRARDYTYDALSDSAELAQDKGSDLRAVIRSLNRPSKPTDVLRNGPVPAEDVAAFAAVYERGRREILTWMTTSTRSRAIRRQLPTL
jgi:7-cyano-7-deazaguanine synthase in queuosine biosynthesis